MAKTLPQRAIGKSGINCSAIGLGCMSFSGVYGPSEDAAATALIHDALDAGITMFDSSDAYGKGHNETLLGNALKGKRQGVVIATKFGNLGGAGGKYADGRPEFVISSCEASSSGSASTSSICITSTASTRTCRSRRRSAR